MGPFGATLRNHQAGFNRLPKPDFVGEDAATLSKASKREDHRVDLMWIRIDAGLPLRGGVALSVVGSADTDEVLVTAGPAICCTPPSNGFAYSGTTTFNVEPGDVYGFEMAGSNADFNSFLNGTLTIGGTSPGAAGLASASVGLATIDREDQWR